jgi:hypothetical protein
LSSNAPQNNLRPTARNSNLRNYKTLPELTKLQVYAISKGSKNLQWSFETRANFFFAAMKVQLHEDG